MLSLKAIRWGLSTTLFDRLSGQQQPMLLDTQSLDTIQNALCFFKQRVSQTDTSFLICSTVWKRVAQRFRMHPTLCEFPAAAFYGGQLRSAAAASAASAPGRSAIEFRGDSALVGSWSYVWSEDLVKYFSV